MHVLTDLMLGGGLAFGLVYLFSGFSWKRTGLTGLVFFVIGLIMALIVY